MVRRIARRYSDGSFNVSSSDDLEAGRRLISGSTDDADTELVEVEILVTRNFGRPKLEVVTPDLRGAAEALLLARESGAPLDAQITNLAAALAAEPKS